MPEPFALCPYGYNIFQMLSDLLYILTSSFVPGHNPGATLAQS